MTAQKGKDLLLKIDDGTGVFVTIAGLRTQRFALNADTVDMTHAESAGRWRELLAGAESDSREACDDRRLDQSVGQIAKVLRHHHGERIGAALLRISR